MKITEAYKNKEQVIQLCKDNNACEDEFNELIRANNQIDFENVLLKNFYWCVKHNVLECWLPKELPNCKILYCYGIKITELPELPNCEEIYCHNTKITELPELPNCRVIHCHNTKITELPELPNCEEIYCQTTKITDFSKVNPDCIIKK